MNALTVEQEVSIFERLFFPPDAARAILSIRFSADDEKRMRELLERNNQGALSADEQAQMEAFRQVGSFLAIMQAKARLQLGTGNGNGHAGA